MSDQINTPKAPEEPATPDVDAVEPVEAPAPGEEALGDKGKKALDSMKAARREAEQRAKAAEDALAALQAKAEGREKEHEDALRAQQVKDEAIAAANARLLKAELRAAATGKLADPSDALAFIDTASIDVSEDGEVDSAAVAALVDALIKTKPHLAAQGTPRVQGSGDGGPRNEGRSPSQLTKDDVQRLYREGKFAEIDAARRGGLIPGF